MKAKSEIRRKARILGYYLRRIYYAFFMTIIGVFTRIDPSKILLSNFFGKGFGCNPRAIAEEIHRIAPEIRLCWLSSDEKTDKTLPGYLDPIRPMSLRYLYELTTAGVWVFNQPIDRGIRKKKGQIYIQTFHGDRALKKVYYQNIGKKKSDLKHAISEQILDYGIAGSTAGESLYTEGLGYTGKLLKYGCPRNDRLLKREGTEAQVTAIKKKLGIDPTTRILLFAPTFRQGKKNFEAKIDFHPIIDLLEKKTGTKWVCMMRAHFHTSTISANNATSDRFIQASDYPDMADLLFVSDILITDYSSSSGDFCLTGRPVILYLDDINEYTRELAISLEQSPYFIAKDQAELMNILEEMTSQKAEENDRKLIDFWGIYETGHATESVVQVIMDHLKTQKSQREQTGDKIA